MFHSTPLVLVLDADFPVCGYEQLRALETSRTLSSEDGSGAGAALDMAAFNVELFRRAVARETELLEKLRTLHAEVSSRL